MKRPRQTPASSSPLKNRTPTAGGSFAPARRCRILNKTVARALGVAFVALILLAIPLAGARAATPGSSEPGTARKIYDALVFRPFGAAQTIVGAAVWIPFYPLAALSDRTSVSSDAADWVTETCITDPVNQTFRKPLGEL